MLGRQQFVGRRKPGGVRRRHSAALPPGSEAHFFFKVTYMPGPFFIVWWLRLERCEHLCSDCGKVWVELGKPETLQAHQAQPLSPEP